MLYWRKKLGVSPSKPMTRSSFKELPSTEEPGVTIEYQRIRIQLCKNVDPMEYLRVLKEQR